MAKKNIIKKLPIIALLAIFLINVAYSKEDFSLTAQGSINLCSCAAQSYKVLIKNTGNEASTYNIQPASNVQSIIKINPLKFSLKPNQRTEFQAIVDAPCQAGSITSQIVVKTDKGLTKALNQKYELQECFSYTITKGRRLSEIKAKIEPESYEGSYEICENSKSFIPLFFSNKDTRDNSYQLSMEGAEWAATPVKEFSIKAKKSAVALIELNPPAKSEGSYQIKVDSISTTGYVKNSVFLDVNVSKCYEVGIELDKAEKKVLCGGDKEEYKVNVANKGRFEEEIRIETEGLEWLSTAEESVNVEAGETKVVSINALPSNEAQGKFNAQLSAFLVKNPEVRSGKESIEFEVKPKSECYKGEIIGKKSIRTSYSEQFVNFRIRNGGERSAKYKLSAEGPSWISAEPSELSLEPGRFFNANVRIDPPEDVAEGEYDAAIKLQYDDVGFSKQIKVNLKKRNPFIIWVVGFYKFYKYYVYLAIVLLIILFLYRNRIKERYKRYRTRKARLNALKKARMARAALKPKKEAKISKARKKKSRKFWVYIAIVIIIAAGIFGRKDIVAYAAYTKDFALAYIAYILLGIAIAAVIIFMIEFYKPLVKMLKEEKKK